MKPEFFVIAFCTLFLGVVLTYTRHLSPGRNASTITIKGDDFTEEINYTGKIELNEDETSVKSISAGGYIRYTKNEKKIAAEGNPNGGITYAFYNEGEKVSMAEGGDEFLAEAISEMIAWGFDAKSRVERLYAKGGSRILLDQVANIKSDYAKNLYFEYILRNDSLSARDMAETAARIDTLLGSDPDKEKFLEKFTSNSLKDSTTASAWLDAAAHMAFDDEKERLLNRFIDSEAISGKNFAQLLTIIGYTGPDNQKISLLKKLIDKNGKTESQWISIIYSAQYINADNDKAGLLEQAATRMPATAGIKTAYLEMAKTLQADADYGRAMRAIE